MNLRKHPFAKGNLVSSTVLPQVWNHSAELIVSLTTMKVIKDRYGSVLDQPDLVLIRLYEAIEAGERVLVLT